MLLLNDIINKHSRPYARPNKVATIFNDVRLTYKDLNDLSNKVANYLVKSRIKRGDRVGVLMKNSWEFEPIYYGAIKIGAIIVPINFWAKGPEIAYTANKAGISVLFFTDEYIGAINSTKKELTSIKKYINIGQKKIKGMENFSAILSDSPETEPNIMVDENDPHLILFTSGTTGFPKGAVISHRSYYLFGGMLCQKLGITEDDIYMNVYPLFHMGGIMSILIARFAGATLVLTNTPPTVKMMLESIEKHKVTTFMAVPTLWKRLLADPEFDSRDLSSLRMGIGASDAMPKELLEEVIRRTGATSPAFYGLTEGTIVTYLSPADCTKKIGSAGKVHCNAEVKLLNEDGNEVKKGDVGEIVFRTDGTMLYYWNDPEETKKALREGWLYTGDLGRFDEDNYLYIVGRKKEMIISGGQNIYPAEVERTLLTNPKIREVAVIGVPDAEWGETVLAVIVMHEGMSMTEEEVISCVKDNLANYNKPRYVKFLNALPRTVATGKIQKKELKVKYTEELGLGK